ncbi:MAG: DUF4276 family protein [Chromatiales bacterium]|nr:DUF4276 family protein [Chromatiales bacterium]
MKIQPVVEGHGEAESVPILLRRLIDEAGAWQIGVGRPVRRTRHQLVHEPELTRSVGIALEQPDCGAILILLDGDDDCPAELGPCLQRVAAQAARGTPGEVVIAHREYEAWFLAGFDSLRGHKMLLGRAKTPRDPERPRDAKGRFERMMRRDTSYVEQVDQPKFSALFDLQSARLRSRSFRKLTKSFGSLLQACGHEIAAWPPGPRTVRDDA